MLVREFDGKNISLIEVGQYHNAVYADGELYTWGWGVYGQLGHGNIFTEDRPKIVRFFGNKVRHIMTVKYFLSKHIIDFPKSQWFLHPDYQADSIGSCTQHGSMREQTRYL